jgi:hypothetical protein
MKKVFAISLLSLTTACASVFSGTTQNTAIDSNPQGARCEIKRNGEVIASVDKTPGNVSFKKTKADAVATCTKDGYLDAQQPLPSGVEPSTYVNIVFGGLVGWGIDAASGAMNKYPEKVIINLSPAPQSYAPSTAPRS